jgi:hypothetical protein
MLVTRTEGRTLGEASSLANEVPVKLLADTWFSPASRAGGMRR